MAQLKVQDAFDLAVQHHNAGRLREAEHLYRQILAQQPEHADSIHYLGVIARQDGRKDMAVDLIRRAIAIRPNYAEAYSNLGNALRDNGQLDAAIAAYRQAIVLNPNLPQAHNNLGSALKDKGQLVEAIAAFRKTIALNPNLHEAHYNLGNVLREMGQLDEAIAAYRRTIALRPNHLEAHTNLGKTLSDKEDFDAAVAAFRQAIALSPNSPEAHGNLGNALKDSGQLDEAIAAYRQAIALNPNLHEAHNNLGNALAAKGQFDDAIAAYRQAIALRPNLPDAHGNLGNALAAKGQFDEAIAAYRRAIALSPDYVEAHSNLGNALRDAGHLDDAIAACRQAIAIRPNYAKAHNNLGMALKDKAQLDEAIAAFRQAIALDPDNALIDSNLVFALQFDPACDAQAILEENRRWNRRHAEPLGRFIQAHSNDRNPNRRLRIGYFGADFREHCQSFFTIPLLSNHDRNTFEIFCYANVARPDDKTERIRRLCDGWLSIAGMTDQEAAQKIREDRIDILVDLTLHMANNRMLLFAQKPAPVQVTWLGYPGTTGLSTMDYRLTDPYLDPPGCNDQFYVETSIRLPDTFWCYDPLNTEVGVNDLPAESNGFITFGSLNNFCKVTEQIPRLWAQVLKTVDRSRLMILCPEGSHRQTLLDVLRREGINPDRIELVAPRPRAKYLELYHRIDVGLDTFPVNGHTTSLDSYWMGVPVVTLTGSMILGSAGLSQLTNLGLTELIARTPQEYVRIAAELANDLPRLVELRRTLRPRMLASPLMDAPRFARGIEGAYRHMWNTWCETVSAKG
jgi:protein O-GlcNAc transferase